MSETSPKGNAVTWRAAFGVGLAIIGALLLFVLDVVKDTAKAIATVQVQIGTITGNYGAKLEDHDRRIGKLEDWRNSVGHP
jgi:hypothetical protein